MRSARAVLEVGGSVIQVGGALGQLGCTLSGPAGPVVEFTDAILGLTHPLVQLGGSLGYLATKQREEGKACDEE